MNTSVMVIVPVYNEENRIAEVLEKLVEYAPNILVVDDGSTDNTKELVISKNIAILSLPKNIGKGMAIRVGINHFLKSDHQVVIFIDGDGQHDPADIPRLLASIDEGYDGVIASRFGNSIWMRNMPWLRKLSNVLSRIGLRILFNGLTIEDPQNGFRAYRRKVLENVKLTRTGYETETELLIKAHLNGSRFASVPIASIYDGDSNSKFSLKTDVWPIPWVMLHLFFKHKPYLKR